MAMAACEQAEFRELQGKVAGLEILMQQLLTELRELKDVKAALAPFKVPVGRGRKVEDAS